ncbi:hypothetical protein [Geoalkalibacter halelectricus]|uniref:hypothetical protein n=1 Tax=Geoalkalibacter halelectricus TaxID=2847045 RepID=UPI003D1B8FBA
MELNESEKKDLMLILEKIFGFQNAHRWEMNESVLETVALMMNEAQKCSKALNHLPRPTYAADKDYLRRQLREIARRANNGEREFYDICAKTTRNKWRTEIERASQGL